MEIKETTGSRLSKENNAKKASGEKLKGKTLAEASAGEKLKFDRNVSAPGSENPSGGRSHGRKPPSSHRTMTYASDRFHEKVRENDDDNAGTDALNRGSQLAEHAETGGSNAVSRWRQKQEIKKEYAASRSGKNAETFVSGTSGAAKGGKKAVKDGQKVTEKIGAAVSEHWPVLLIGGGILILILVIVGSISSCSVMFQGGTNVVVDTSFTADDSDIIGTEADYCSLENGLQVRINNIRNEYPGYDEYNITQDQIGHNPYELASYLTVLLEDYKRNQAQPTLQTLFNGQYSLSVSEQVETRYRTELQTKERMVKHTEADPDTGELYEVMVPEEYQEEVQVPYQYRILNVDLDNKGFGAAFSTLSEDEMTRYSLLMQTKGNRSDLFSDNPSVTAAVLHYDIPGEALTDERFRNMITEAEKYLGFPYVWGGESPSTSFDCSGFVSWVINHCGNGWSYGRLTAEGFRQVCSIIPTSEAKPGDLIFFQGTYDTAGASHVGIYVGNGMMLHCGNPISYASIDTAYCREHFYCFGRLP